MHSIGGVICYKQIRALFGETPEAGPKGVKPSRGGQVTNL